MSRRGNKTWVVVILVVSASLLPYLNILGNGFAFDDEGLVLKNEEFSEGQPLLRALRVPFWPGKPGAGLYRPLTQMLFSLGRHLWGANPMPYHALTVILHVLATLAAWVLLRQICGPRAAIVGALLFAVHPIHTEAVAPIAGTCELLAGLFGFLGYNLWLKQRGWRTNLAAGSLLALAVASKENAAAWFLLILANQARILPIPGAQGAFQRGTDRLRSFLRKDTLLLFLPSVPYWVMRLKVLGRLLGITDPSQMENPLRQVDVVLRIATALWVQVKYLFLVAYPSKLSPSYGQWAIEPLRSLLTWKFFAALALVAAFIALWVVSARSPRTRWCLGAYALLHLPTANIIFATGTIMAERLMYTPTVALFGLLGLAAGSLASRFAQGKTLGAVLFALLLGAFGLRTWDRNRDWKNDLTLFAEATRTQPRCAKAWHNLGAALSSAGRYEEAQHAYEKSLEILPDYVSPMCGLSHSLVMMGKFEEARRVLEKAIAIHPRGPEPRIRLGNVLLELHNPQAALKQFKVAIDLSPESWEAWVGAASSYFMSGQYQESATAWVRAQELAPQDNDFTLYLATAFKAAGAPHLSEAVLRRGLRQAREPARVRAALARLLLSLEPGSPEGIKLARAAYDSLRDLRTLGTLLEHLLADRRCAEAGEVLQGATWLEGGTHDSLRAKILERCQGLRED